MKLFIITVVVLLQGCGSVQFPEQAGTTQNLKYLKHVDDALAFLRRHPATKTRGILSKLYADELDMHPTVWGRYVNSDFFLMTYEVAVDGKVERFIFVKGFTPDAQITRYLESLDPEILKRGVPIAQVGKHVAYKRDSWSLRGFNKSIGSHLDQKKYVTSQIKGDGRPKKLIFVKGFTPDAQITRYLESLDPEMLKRGVPIAQVGDNVTYKQDSWSLRGFNKSIGSYLDQKKYVTRKINVDVYIFAKDFTPDDQITRYLKGLDPEILKRGVPIAQVGDNVAYRQDSWSLRGFHNSIGKYLDQKKYVTRQISVDGRNEKLIFAKGFTPSDQIVGYIRSLNPEILKRGVPIAEVGDNVVYRQDSWSLRGFHYSIGSYLDKKKYVTRQINVDGRWETYIFAK